MISFHAQRKNLHEYPTLAHRLAKFRLGLRPRLRWMNNVKQDNERSQEFFHWGQNIFGRATFEIGCTTRGLTKVLKTKIKLLKASIF